MSAFEKEHFHPLNVTPDRSCTAYFHADSSYTSKDLFDSLRSTDIPPTGVRCLQRKPNGDVLVTFTKADFRHRFLEKSVFSIIRSNYSTYTSLESLSFLTVYDAPYEPPDSAIEERLKPYCTVYSRRRCRLQGYPDVCNGIRTYRVQIKHSVPCYLRFGKFQLRLYHDNQQKTCRRCGSADHLADECENEVCFNCDQIGHVASSCPEAMRCCICKSLDQKAIDCPFSWYRRPASVREAEDSPQSPDPSPGSVDDPSQAADVAEDDLLSSVLPNRPDQPTQDTGGSDEPNAGLSPSDSALAAVETPAVTDEGAPSSVDVPASRSQPAAPSPPHMLD